MSEGHTERLDAALAGRYRIERKLGEGGMASVYLAEDLKHERKVALKILRPELAAVIGAERFLSEIKTTANLQHPHILPLFDSGEAGGYLYYVMPYIDGETLRQKLDREKQLGVEESVRIVRDVADALDYAHRHGVIHRDIKPGNILLHDGRPVVADFGIALAVSAAGGGRMTETGLSLGTPHYMSPEQASADRDLTARSDVYSLGCVLYEMIGGQPPHTGPSAQSILVHILTKDVTPLTDLRHTVPPNVAAAVAKSIEKLPADRFETAKAFRDALEDAGFAYQSGPRTATSAEQPALSGPRSTPRLPWRRDRRFLGAVSVGGVLAVLAAFGWLRPAPATQAADPVRFSFDTRIDFVAAAPDLAISPNGKLIAYKVPNADRSRPLIETRALADLTGAPLRGGEDGESPFASPNGQWVGFVPYQTRATLEKVSVLGGAPVMLAQSPSQILGASWGDDGQIVFGTLGDGLFRVSEAGGEPEQLTVPDTTLGEQAHSWPSIIQGRGAVIFTIVGSGTPALAGELAVLDLKSGSVHRLGVQGSGARYVSAGYLVYGAEDQSVRAVPFDAGSLDVTGGAVPLLENVAVKESGAVDFDVSRDGTLVYITADRVEAGGVFRALVWVDRNGREESIQAALGGYRYPRISPDGRRMAVDVSVGDGVGIWIWDFAATTLSPLFLGEGTFSYPVWTPRGDRIAYSDGRDILWKASNNTGAPEVLLKAPVPPGADGPRPYFFAADGSTLVLGNRSNPDTNDDLLMLPVGTTDPSPIWRLNQPYNERNAELSPDGRWMAYISTESGATQVYVRPFPDVDADQVQVSNGRASHPLWSRDGSELFYLQPAPDGGQNQLVSVTVVPNAADRRFAFRDRTVLFDWPYYTSTGRAYDVADDGRFLAIRTGNSSLGDEPTEVTVVLNWLRELKERMGG